MSVLEKHVEAIKWIREEFFQMDEMLNPLMGIKAWDDCTCVEFGGKKLLVSIDGPYTKRLVMKSALIHASTDVVVKGGKPLFALDALIGREEELREMVASLKHQAEAMRIPILGGNTLYEDTEARCTLVVVGELLLEEPIRDSGVREGDVLVLIGETIWGSREERIRRAKKLFATWYEILGELRVNAAKDVTKGGLLATVYEMCQKSNVGFDFEGLKELKLPLTRNLDNFLAAIEASSLNDLLDICERNGCPCLIIGEAREVEG